MPETRLARCVIIALVVAVAFAVRFYKIADPPFDFQTIRQFHSASIAKWYYLENTDAPKDVKVAAKTMSDRMDQVEPRIMEHLASRGYHLLGGARLWFPRLMSVFFWLVAGCIIYRLCVRAFGYDAAFLALVYFLLLPYGVSASRSFQPDPLMIMALAATLYSMWRYFAESNKLWYVAAVAAGAFAIFVKAYAVFPVVAVFGYSTLHQTGIDIRLAGRKALFAVLVLIPAAIYYGNGLFGDGYLGDNAGLSFHFNLLLEWDYWSGWADNIAKTVGYLAFVAAILGVVVSQRSLARSYLVGAWAGYFVFSLIFTYHTATHSYYQMMLIVIVSISIAHLASQVLGPLAEGFSSKKRKIAFVIVVIFAIGLVVRELPGRFIVPWKEELLASYYEVGQIVDHSTETVVLDSFSRLTATYYGDFAAVRWPSQSELDGVGFFGLVEVEKHSVSEYVARLSQDAVPEFFIVFTITDKEKLEWHGQTKLKDYLSKNYSLVAANERFIIYDMREKRFPPL